MMKGTFALFQLNRHRLERYSLLFGQDTFNRMHVIRESGDRQKIPAMTPRHVMEASVRARRIVESDPARQVGHGLRPRPVGIILMPGHHAAMMRRFAKELIVPETHRAAE